jgi:hypothetical protein
MFKPRNLNPSPVRLVIPAVATLGLVGIFFNSRRGSDEPEKVGSRARAKRDEDNLNGAGIGGNMQSGGSEAGSLTGKGHDDGSVQTTASSRDELPSGGVGGGHGGGNSNTRAVEMSPSKGPSGEQSGILGKIFRQGDSGPENTSSTSSGNSSTSTSSGSGAPASTSQSQNSLSQRLQGTFQQGGASSGEPGENARKYSDTRIHSNLPDTPTKRGQMRSDS